MKKFAVALLALLLSFATVFVGCGDNGDSSSSQDEGVREVSIFSRPLPKRNGLNAQGKKVDWLDVSSFVCYYGQYDEKMTNFDVAICESRSLGAEGIKKLNDAGVWTICYITIGEDDSLNTADGLGEGGYASYYIYENGSPKMNTNWNSYFVDAGNPVWQEIIIERARKILAMGADGLFLDTIDTVDIDASTCGGMVSLVKRLKEEFPNAKLVANRGFTVLDYIAKYIDGMMFESFNTTWDFGGNRSRDLSESENEYNIATAVNTINRNRRAHYFPVFALDYLNPNEVKYLASEYANRCWKYDFISYLQENIGLDHITEYTVNLTAERGSLALKGEGDIAQTAGQPNGDTSADNLAYVKNGATLEVDSYYSVDYKNNKTAALNDAFISENMYWAKRAWASADEKVTGEAPYEQDHWITVEFTEVKDVSEIIIHWAFDNGIYYSSSEIVIEKWVDGEWVAVHTQSDIAQNSPEVEIRFDSISTQKLRIRQPAGMGAQFRKGIMWVAEIEIYS